jgi:DNA-binding XRE family transcriptional regulator
MTFHQSSIPGLEVIEGWTPPPAPRRVEYSDARAAAGLTQAELAELVGVTPQTIKRLERGRADVSRPVLLACRYVLGMPREGSA